MIIRTWAVGLCCVLLSVFSTHGYAVKISEKQIARVGNGAELRELDPSKSVGVPESHVIDNLFEGLTSLDPVKLEPLPGVAESWSLSKDQLVYTFKIRKNVKWSDGKPITAEDFVWSWTRTLAPETASEYAYQLFYVKNGEAYNNGSLKDPKKLGFRAVDPYTFEVTLNSPTSFFLRLTAFHTLFPTPKHVVTKFKSTEWTKPQNMVSNGPFMLQEWKLNQHIKMIPNPHYWDKDTVSLKEVYYYPIENADTEERNFFANKLDMTYEAGILKIPTYEAEKKRNPGKYHPYHSFPYLGTYFYRFNTKRKPFDDKRVRRAFNLVVDRTALVERVLRGGQEPATFFTPPNTAGYTHAPVLPASVDANNIAEAKKLLAEAGYPDGKGFPKIEINFNTDDKHRKVALAIQQMLKKNLNIEVGLYSQEWKVYLDNQSKLNYDLQRAGWIGDYPDPNTFLDLFMSKGGNNNTGWGNKEYDRLISEAGKTTDQKKRFELFTKAEDILLEELPILPIYLYTLPRLVSERIRMKNKDGKMINYTSNIQDRYMFKYWVMVNP